ncbi:hypothetical protein HAX54_024118 [Datura stramonium]|uniref:Uncharacterized protein n=1 Tax=Datura stramonium TaxID=4076 RepID=A0ABS8UZI2_DATST|nr:hypothetical protein [Datura stramonium]
MEYGGAAPVRESEGDPVVRVISAAREERKGRGKNMVARWCGCSRWLGHYLDPATHRHFADCDRWLVDKSPVETSLPSVLLTIDGSSLVCESPPAVC